MGTEIELGTNPVDMPRHCACGAGRSEQWDFFASGETDFKHCLRCGLVARERFPTEAELATIYGEAYADDRVGGGATNQESGDFALASYANFMVRKMVRPGIRTLDYGAGTGVLVQRLRDAGVQAEGFEFSSAAREYCRTQRGIELLASIDAVPDASYEAISMIEVIEHLTDLTGTLQALRRVLAPGGLMLVTTPNRNTWRARREGGHWREARKKFHLFLFDAASLEHHLARAGFEVTRRVVFAPLQRPGLRFLLAARTLQLFGMQGSLCVVARRRT